mgnify:CR=1 FL=1
MKKDKGKKQEIKINRKNKEKIKKIKEGSRTFSKPGVKRPNWAGPQTRNGYALGC